MQRVRVTHLWLAAAMLLTSACAGSAASNGAAVNGTVGSQTETTSTAEPLTTTTAKTATDSVVVPTALVVSPPVLNPIGPFCTRYRSATESVDASPTESIAALLELAEQPPAPELADPLRVNAAMAAAFSESEDDFPELFDPDLFNGAGGIAGITSDTMNSEPFLQAQAELETCRGVTGGTADPDLPVLPAPFCEAFRNWADEATDPTAPTGPDFTALARSERVSEMISSAPDERFVRWIQLQRITYEAIGADLDADVLALDWESGGFAVTGDDIASARFGNEMFAIGLHIADCFPAD